MCVLNSACFIFARGLFEVGDFLSAFITQRKEEEAVMEVLRNMFPNACDVRKVGAVGGVIKQDIYQVFVHCGQW